METADVVATVMSSLALLVSLGVFGNSLRGRLTVDQVQRPRPDVFLISVANIGNAGVPHVGLRLVDDNNNTVGTSGGPGRVIPKEQTKDFRSR
jgi:hypothetical protein